MKLWRCKSHAGNGCYLIAVNEEEARDVFQVVYPQSRMRSRISVKHCYAEPKTCGLKELLAGTLRGRVERRSRIGERDHWFLTKVVH